MPLTRKRARRASIPKTVIITLRAMPEGHSLQTWTVGAYTLSPFLWSPDNHFLAAMGSVPQKPETALFLFEIR